MSSRYAAGRVIEQVQSDLSLLRRRLNRDSDAWLCGALEMEQLKLKRALVALDTSEPVPTIADAVLALNEAMFISRVAGVPCVPWIAGDGRYVDVKISESERATAPMKEGG